MYFSSSHAQAMLFLKCPALTGILVVGFRDSCCCVQALSKSVHLWPAAAKAGVAC